MLLGWYRPPKKEYHWKVQVANSRDVVMATGPRRAVVVATVFASVRILSGTISAGPSGDINSL